MEKLDAAIGTNALTEEENAWARLLRYYLANPNDGDYSDYPKTPEELPSLPKSGKPPAFRFFIHFSPPVPCKSRQRALQ